MPIDVACICGKRFRVRDEHAGRKGKCPSCGNAVVIPKPVQDPAPEETLETVVAATEVRQKACPSCGAVISYFALVCEQCGARLTTGPAKGTRTRSPIATTSKARAAPRAPGSPVVGIALGLGTGLFIAYGSAWAYAYIDLFFPIWSILITAAFGAVLGFVPSLIMFAGGLRNRTIGVPIIAVIVGFGYWLTWAVWVHAALNHNADAPSVGFLMAHPSELTTWIGAIHEVGVWRYSGDAEPVHGTMLTIVWLGEAILILGAAMTAAWTTLRDDLPS